MEYPKINTLFKRDDKNIIIPSQYTCEEFNYLSNCLWECTEKVDGANTRIYITMEAGEGEDPWFYGVTIKGRTDRTKLRNDENARINAGKRAYEAKGLEDVIFKAPVVVIGNLDI